MTCAEFALRIYTIQNVVCIICAVDVLCLESRTVTDLQTKANQESQIFHCTMNVHYLLTIHVCRPDLATGSPGVVTSLQLLSLTDLLHAHYSLGHEHKMCPNQRTITINHYKANTQGRDNCLIIQRQMSSQAKNRYTAERISAYLKQQTTSNTNYCKLLMLATQLGLYSICFKAEWLAANPRTSIKPSACSNEGACWLLENRRINL